VVSHQLAEVLVDCMGRATVFTKRVLLDEPPGKGEKLCRFVVIDKLYDKHTTHTTNEFISLFHLVHFIFSFAFQASPKTIKEKYLAIFLSFFLSFFLSLSLSKTEQPRIAPISAKVPTLN